MSRSCFLSGCCITVLLGTPGTGVAAEPDFLGVRIKMTYGEFDKALGNQASCEDKGDWRECTLTAPDPVADEVVVSFRKPWGDRAYYIRVQFAGGVLHKHLRQKLLEKYGSGYSAEKKQLHENQEDWTWEWKLRGSRVWYWFNRDTLSAALGQSAPFRPQSLEIVSEEHKRWLQGRDEAPVDAESANRVKRSRF